MTAARPPPAVQRSVSNRSATDSKLIKTQDKDKGSKTVTTQDKTVSKTKTDIFMITKVIIPIIKIEITLIMTVTN